jgi:hypothetical protein
VRSALSGTVASSTRTTSRPNPVFCSVANAGSFTFPSSGYMHLGPPDHFLGVLFVTAGRWEDADAHFANALALQEAMRARTLAAHTLYWRARMLARRRALGDVEWAGAILAGVSATTAALGIGGLDRQVRTLLESLEG